MKICPLCAEEIQDKAIRCKHCGGDIPAHAAAEQYQNAERNAKAATGLWNRIAIVSLIVIGSICGYLVASSVSTSMLKIAEGTGISALLFPIAWTIGKSFGKIAQPDIILSTGVIDLAFKRIGYFFLPLTFAIVGSAISLYVVANVVRDPQSTKTEISKPNAVAPTLKPVEQPITAPASVAKVQEPVADKKSETTPQSEISDNCVNIEMEKWQKQRDKEISEWCDDLAKKGEECRISAGQDELVKQEALDKIKAQCLK